MPKISIFVIVFVENRTRTHSELVNDVLHKYARLLERPLCTGIRVFLPSVRVVFVHDRKYPDLVEGEQMNIVAHQNRIRHFA